MQKERQSMGPFKAIGTTLSTVGTVVGAVDNIVVNTDSLISKGFDAINVLVDNSLADLNADNIVEDAHRQVRIASAKAEAAEILATLNKA